MKCFDLTIENHVAHVVMNRPDKRNSMIREFWEELPQLVQEIDNGAKARVIVISSTGPHFTSGLDTSLFNGLAHSDAETKEEHALQAPAIFYNEVKRLQKTFSALEAARIPILVAIQGGCIGGGLDLITACDMRYATKDAFFTLFETNLAMTADVGTFPRLAKLIPEGYVKEMAYTGKQITAADAHRFGLVNKIYNTKEEMLSAVLEIAHEIGSKAPLAVHGCKTMINYSRDHLTADTLDYIALWNSSHFNIEEIVEAMAANKEKRLGNFVNLPKRQGA
jgi:enoyl-CoA hydratase